MAKKEPKQRAQILTRPGGFVRLVSPEGVPVLESRSRELLRKEATRRGWEVLE